jgi:hypothetical protein
VKVDDEVNGFTSTAVIKSPSILRDRQLHQIYKNGNFIEIFFGTDALAGTVYSRKKNQKKLFSETGFFCDKNLSLCLSLRLN